MSELMTAHAMTLAGRKSGQSTLTRNWDAIVAHQLKTPLCVLDARLSMSDRVDTEVVRSDLRKITRLIDQLQTFATVRNEDATNKKRFLLVPHVRKTCLNLVPLASKKEIDLVFRDFSNARYTFGNEDLFDEVLSNIIENAIKYSPVGSVVNIIAAANGSVYVIDNGPGIKDSDKDHVFDAFRRGTTGNATSGTGLGLFLCRAIMEKQGGSVNFRNRRRGGTIFDLQFPVA